MAYNDSDYEDREETERVDGVASSSVAARRPLIVDALNKLNYFIPIEDVDFAGASPWELVAAMQTRLSKFIVASLASGFEPHFVVDNGWVTDEARDKWTARKTEEVLREDRSMPLSADTLLCEMIRARGATLYYAQGRAA